MRGHERFLRQMNDLFKGSIRQMRHIDHDSQLLAETEQTFALFCQRRIAAEGRAGKGVVLPSEDEASHTPFVELANGLGLLSQRIRSLKAENACSRSPCERLLEFVAGANDPKLSFSGSRHFNHGIDHLACTLEFGAWML